MERREAAELLHEASDLLGHIPTPVADLLADLLDSETSDAGRVLRFLRLVCR
jgi:hypothetical protein